MTMLDDPPAVAESVTARSASSPMSNAGWRLAARLARRETRRRPGRTVLAGLLIAVPVVAMTIGSVLARTENNGWADQFARRYGSADIAVDATWYGATNAELTIRPVTDVALPAGTTSTDYLWTYASVFGSDPSDRGGAGVVFTDLTIVDGGRDQAIEVVKGRAPRPGEVLLGAGAAKALGVSVGDRLTLRRPSGSWIVSGLGRERDSYWNEPFVVPGFDRARITPELASVTKLYTLPPGTPVAQAQRLANELGGFTRYDDPYGAFDSGVGRGIAWGWVGGVLALVAVGIIVAAAFATSARNQLVMIGQLSSNGATPKMIRRTLALQGTWTGLAGSLFGLAAGLAALPVVTPLFERTMAHDLPAYRFSVIDFVVIGLTATVAGTLAALVPARSASQIPVMSALAGRRPLARPPRWLVPTGLGLLGGGLALTAIGALGSTASSSSSGSSPVNDSDLWALVIVVGVVGIVFGMVCATPLVIERVGSLGRRWSLSWRLALRSLVRSRTRSSAVVAAIAVAVGASVAVAALAEVSIRQNQAYSAPTVPADAAVFEFYQDLTSGDGVIDVAPLTDQDLPGDTRQRLLSIIPDAEIVPLRYATSDPPSINTATYTGPWVDPTGPRIADEALLGVIGLTPADVNTLDSAGALQLTSRYGGWIADEQGGPGDNMSTAEFADESGVITVSAPIATTPSAYEFGGYGLIITEQHALELGFQIVERGAIVRSGSPLTLAQRDELAALNADIAGVPYDPFIEPGDPPATAGPGTGGVAGDWWNVMFDQPQFRRPSNDIWIARSIVVAAAVLLSLLVVAIGLSLAAAEGRDDRDVLTVVGATPASLRRQAAARAAVLASTGIMLGVPTGFVPAWVLYRITSSDNGFTDVSIRFPWLVVVALVLAVPTVVAGVAWAGSGIAQRFRPASPTRHD